METFNKIKAATKGKILAALIIAVVMGIIAISPSIMAFAGMGDYWEIKIGGEHFAYVSGESDVIMLSNAIKDEYVSGSFGVKDISFEPELSAERGIYNRNEEEIDIAGNPTTLIPELLNKVDVVVVYEEIATKDVPYETIYEEDAEMYDDEEYIKRPGEKGSKLVLDEVTRINGEEVGRREVSVMEEVPPVKEIVVKGTKVSPYFIYPVEGKITFYFGYRSSGSTYGVGSTNHKGIDITVPTGTPVKAGRDGVVVKNTGWYGGYGNVVFIDHGDGIVSVYAHNSSLNVKVGDKVSRGDIIAYSGSTGASTAPHVHFEVQVNGKAVDPLNYL